MFHESARIRKSREDKMTLPLEGKAILVTGAGRRVGAAVARRLHEAGGHLVLHYRSAAREAQALARELNACRAHSALAVQADLLDTEKLGGLVDAAVAAFGRLDGLVNNASSFFPTPVGGIGEREWNDIVGTNFKSPLFLTQAAAPQLRLTHGAVVNITDIHAERPLAGYALYCAAKAGLAGLTRALALELGPEVRVNGVAPGPILWPDDGSFDERARAAVVRRTLLKRVGEPDDIARAVLFLMADAAYVTGQILAVDGGRSVVL